jgi:hypothetical protein
MPYAKPTQCVAEAARTRLPLLVIFLVLLTASATAQEVPVSVYGLGSKSCGTFIAATNDLGPGETRTAHDFYSLNALFNQYALGYITASNLLDGNPIHGVDLAGIDLALRRYCQVNPTANFATAVHQFIQSERQRRGR